MKPSVKVNRLCDLDDWEFYPVVRPVEDHGADSVLCIIGLRLQPEFQQVEYELWTNKGDDEPYSSGTIECDNTDSTWSDTIREDILREVISSKGLADIGTSGIFFSFGNDDLSGEGGEEPADES